MDLYCTENLYIDPNPEFQLKQQQHTETSKPLLIPNAPSPCSNSLSNSSLSSGYGSIRSVSSITADACPLCPSSTTSVNSRCSHKPQSTGTDTRSAYVVITEGNPISGAQQTVTITHTNTASAQTEEQHRTTCDNDSINKHLSRNNELVNTAAKDDIFLTDRCLENALREEEKRPQPICTYFKTVQKDITPAMRKIVAEWMMEVCAEEKCQEEVVLLALNYLDRFLSMKSVRKTHLQILGAACLLLASKLREPSCRALSAELLVFYTDNSIFKNDLIKWELYVLSRLGWDLASVTPLDFLELLLIRLPIRSKDCPDLNVDKVRQHAQAFISLAAKEHYFSVYSASTIAASSIAAAMIGLNWHRRTGNKLSHLLDLLTDLTSIEQDYLHDCMIKMESVFTEHSRNLQPYLTQQLQHQPHQSQHQHSMHCSHDRSGNVNGNSLLPDLTQTCKMQANAQKDVQDIKF